MTLLAYVLLYDRNLRALKVSIDQFHNDFGGDPQTALFRMRAKVSDGRTIESENQKILDEIQQNSLCRLY